MSVQKYKRFFNLFLLLFCFGLLWKFSSKQSIPAPSSSADGKRTWINAYTLENHMMIETGMWGENDDIYTCAWGNELGTSEFDMDMYVVKWDRSGRVVWDFIDYSENHTRAYGITGFDNNLYVYGSTKNNSLYLLQYHIIKLDTSGDTIWTKSWGDNETDQWNAFIYEMVCDETGMYALGEFGPMISNTTSYELLKIDFDGNIIWNITWEDKNYNQYSGLQVDNSALYLACEFYYAGISDSGINLVKWNKSGNFLWNRSLFQNTDTEGVLFNSMDMDETTLYLCGTRFSVPDDQIYGFICGIDTEAQILWNNSISTGLPKTYGFGISYNSEEIFLVGNAEETNQFDEQIQAQYYFARLTKNGEFISVKTTEIVPMVWFVGEFYLHATEKNLYQSWYYYGGMVLEKIDISISYFARIGIPIISVCVSGVLAWVIIKYIKKRKIKGKESVS